MSWFHAMLNSGPTALPDYRTNIYDEWISNRSLRLKNDVTTVNGWWGVENDNLIQRFGADATVIAIPTNQVLTFNGTDARLGFPLTGSTNLETIIGNCTFVYKVRGSAAKANANPLWDSFNTSAPRTTMYLELSNTVSEISIRYNGVNYSTTQDFAFDNAWHTVVYRFGNNVADCWYDGVQVGNWTTTGGAPNFNTGTPIMSFTNVTGSNFYGKYDIQKLRIYTEWVSDANLAIMLAGPLSQTEGNTNDTHVVFVAGQSNANLNDADHQRDDFPVNLQTGLTEALFYDYEALYGNSKTFFRPITDNTTIFLSGSLPLNCGPWLKVAKELLTNYPSDEIRMVQIANSATSLAVEWLPTSGTMYTNWLTTYRPALRLLLAEGRNIASITFLWIQGENDATNATYAANYETNLTSFMSDFRTKVQAQLDLYSVTTPIKVVISKLSDQTTFTYKNDVRTAQENWVALNTTLNKIVNTDNATDFPMEAGKVHFLPNGMTEIGRVAATHI